MKSACSDVTKIYVTKKIQLNAFNFSHFTFQIDAKEGITYCNISPSTFDKNKV